MGDQVNSVNMPDLAVSTDSTMLFMFSAITWNRHRIHYDAEAARQEGHADVVAQRALIGNFFARHLKSWRSGQGNLERLSWKVVNSALPGQELIVKGTGRELRTDPRGDTWWCEQELIVASTQQVIATAQAEVGFPS